MPHLSLYRKECEELRSEQSKQLRDEIFRDREHQIQIKQDQKFRDAEMERFYAQLWEQDRLAKADREELETQEQMERNRSTLDVCDLFKFVIFCGSCLEAAFQRATSKPKLCRNILNRTSLSVFLLQCISYSKLLKRDCVRFHARSEIILRGFLRTSWI